MGASESSPLVKGVNNIVAALGSDDVVSSVPQFLDGAIVNGVYYFFYSMSLQQPRKRS